MVIIGGIVYYNFKNQSNFKLRYVLRYFTFISFSFCPTIQIINKLMVVLIAGVVKLVDALDSKSSILRDVSVRARPSVQSWNPFLIEGVFIYLLIDMVSQITHDFPISGYIFRDTVVGTITRVSEIIPQPHTIHSYPSLQTNIY